MFSMFHVQTQDLLAVENSDNHYTTMLSMIPYKEYEFY